MKKKKKKWNKKKVLSYVFMKNFRKLITEEIDKEIISKLKETPNESIICD